MGFAPILPEATSLPSGNVMRGRAEQKRRFGGEFFPARFPEGATGRAFVEVFQTNKLTGEQEGIVAIRSRGRRQPGGRR